MAEEKNELTLDELKAMMKESEAYENALENGEISPEQAIDDLFEKYPIKIDLNILKQIKEHILKFVRLFFIVGKNTDLAESVATCIFTAYKWAHDLSIIEIPLGTKKKTYISIKMTFKKHSYVGWYDTEIKEHLFLSKEPDPLINHFKKDNMLFLRGINDTKILERLVDTVRNETWGRGVLIINVPGMDIIPQGLSGKFEIIELEPKKQDTAQVAIELKYDKDRHILFTNGKYLQLTGDKKILIEYLFEGRKSIDLLRDKIAQSKGKNNKQYATSNCRKLITKTNKVIEKEFSTKDFIRNEKNKSGFYCLTSRPKEGVFKGNIEVIQR